MRNLTLFTVLLFFGFVCAQNPDRIYKSHKEEDGKFTVTTSDGQYIFQFYNPEILETTFIPIGQTNDNDSHAVVIKPAEVETTYSYVGNDITYGSDGISVTITTEPFEISYSYKNKPIISEKRGYYKSDHVPMEMVKGNIVADKTEKIEFNLTQDEVLYGGGARALGMNRRGNRLPLYNRAHYGYQTESKLLNFSMPIVMSSKQYMIHFDNAPIGYLDFDSKGDNTLTYETISGRKTYQIIVGNSWYDVLDNYTDLTGKQPMLPRWALGNFSSRFGYHTQDEVMETVEKFREANIPVDAIILDLYWFGKDVKGTMGNLAFLRDSFPNPEKMIKDLAADNVETILITEPFILTTSKRWEETVEKNVLAKDSVGNPARYDFYFGNTGIVDIYSKTGNQWFKDIYKGLGEMGVNGFWGDLGEPEVLPSWVEFEKGSADEVHNIYGHDWAKLVQEASLEANPNKRPFILMRAGYSGSQRYAMVPWSGDVSRSWGGLQSQPEIALQMGMQGMAYMHSDLGGFAGANLDDNLYVRWLQYGVFQPIFRPHAQEDVPSEPVFRSERAKKLSKKAIELRYKILPYNYHLMYENHTKGTPLMRPLFFEESDNPELSDYSNAYLWGNDFLVAPILKDSVVAKQVYFPKGSNWFDFYTGDKMEGGKKKVVKVSEDNIPTYVRGGVIIPMTKIKQSTSLYTGDTLELHYFLDRNTGEQEREYYHDNGKTLNAFEHGRFEIWEFEAEFQKRQLEFELEAELGENQEGSTKSVELVIHNLEALPRKIKIKGEKANANWNPDENQLILYFDWNTTEEKEIKIKIKK
ncbi:MAG: TIM-barrel domain-containing protein [Bacteroidota bacterium]